MLARLGPRASAAIVALVVLVLAALAFAGIIDGAALVGFLGGLLLSSPPDLYTATSNRPRHQLRRAVKITPRHPRPR